jgi:hypothetical protein
MPITISFLITIVIVLALYRGVKNNNLVVNIIQRMAVVQLFVIVLAFAFFIFAVLSSFIAFNEGISSTSTGSKPGFNELGVAANFLTAISVAVGAFGAIGTLLVSIAPAVLSKFGFGPCLDLDFSETKEYVHSWESETGGAKSVFIRMAVTNGGFIGAESVECLVEQIKKDDMVQDRIPERLRWAHSWQKKLSELEPGQSDRNDDLPKSISPQSRAFVDFGFILEPNSKFYSVILPKLHGLPQELTDQLKKNNFWCLHLADRWIPSEAAILTRDEMINRSTKYRITLCLVAKNSHAVRRDVIITIGHGELTSELFEKNRVVGASDNALVIIKIDK